MRTAHIADLPETESEGMSEDLSDNLWLVVTMPEILEIESREFWFKVVEFLQQNWALIDGLNNEKCMVYFISDTSDIFDEMEFVSLKEATSALIRNGFSLYAEDREVQKFIFPPESPFQRRPHPNGPIYSSGKFWC